MRPEAAPSTAARPFRRAVLAGLGGGAAALLLAGCGLRPSVKRGPAAQPTPPPRPLPDVLSADRVTYATLPAAEIAALQDRDRAQRVGLVPLPDLVRAPGIAVSAVTHRSGVGMLAIRGDRTGEITLPALCAGRVTRVAVPATASYCYVVVTRPDGEGIGLIVPSPATTRFHEGESIAIGAPAITVRRDPTRPEGQQFARYLQTQFEQAPADTICCIERFTPRSPAGEPMSLQDLLGTPQGALATVALAG